MLKEYIKESSNRIKKERKELFFFNTIPLIIKEDIKSAEVDLSLCLSQIEKIMPSLFVRDLDGIYIGDFDILNLRKLTALYLDGAIYVTNRLTSNKEFVDGVVHEIGHIAEQKYGMLLYSDKSMKKEFSNKKLQIYELLKTQEKVIPPIQTFMGTEQNQNLDLYLYDRVGYRTLFNLIVGIFISPYSITSLSEYFAIGFERFYGSPGERGAIRKICPALFQKLLVLHKETEEENEF